MDTARTVIALIIMVTALTAIMATILTAMETHITIATHIIIPALIITKEVALKV